MMTLNVKRQNYSNRNTTQPCESLNLTDVNTKQFIWLEQSRCDGSIGILDAKNISEMEISPW